MVIWKTLYGLIPYQDAITLMKEKLDDVISGKSEETIYLLEHQAVYTAGTSALDSELLTKTSIPAIKVGRGGKYTYHGPGQRVIYPIIDLRKPSRTKDIHLYVNNLEKWIIQTLERFNINCYSPKDQIGVWTNIISDTNQIIPAKIAAIGIRVKKWVTSHGIAVNIFNDLEGYKAIIPCGLPELAITSTRALGNNITLEEFDAILKKEFNNIF